MTQPEPVLLTQEEFAQHEPLTTRLQGLVRSYPKGVGLVQEFLQNADDAGAQSVSVFLDNRCYPSQRLPAPSMSALQGPAIVVTNDARFSPDDWNNIQQIGASGKALDATKTGRFGLGFNCVYNVTDFPMLLTGTRIGIFDPHGHTVDGASPVRPGNAWRLNSALWTQCSDLLVAFESYGLSRDDIDYAGTAFRLPLRTQSQATKSEICDQPFTSEDFDSIVEKLRDDLGDLLLFLRNVQDVDLWSIDSAGHRRLLLSAHTVNRQIVEESRKRLRQALQVEHESLLTALTGANAGPVVSEYNHEIDFTDTDGSCRPLVYRVVNGLFSDVAGKVTECARQMLLLNEKAVPLAGAAVRLDIVPDAEFKGRVFCSLPLPLASPLGHCHVNGFFDLQADRQGLFQDPGAGGTSAYRVNWNRLLLEHCCSDAAARLVASISQDIQSSPGLIYEHWPRVPRQERSILDALPRYVYGLLRNHKCIAAGRDRKWHLPKDVTELTSQESEELRIALLSDIFPLPNPPLPDFIREGFARSGSTLAAVSPASLRAQLRVLIDPDCELRGAPRACLKDVKWVNALFQFCTSDNMIDDLLGVPLAYMANGKLRAFGRNLRAPIYLAGAEEREIFANKSDWFIDSLQEGLGKLKDSKPVGTLRLTPQRVVANLGTILRPGPDGRVTATSDIEGTPSQEWLCRVFDYISSHKSELKLDGELINKLALVPDQFGTVHVMGTANTPLLPGTEDPRALLNAIGEIGVPLVTGGEPLLKSVRGFIEAFPNVGVWRLSAMDLIDTLSAIASRQSSPDDGSFGGGTKSILEYLAAPRAVRDLADPNAGRSDKLRKLRLFLTTSGKVVSLDTGDHFIPASFKMPSFATEVGILDTGTNDRWLPLYRALRVPTLTRARLVTKVLLPKLGELSESDRFQMLLWLRSNLHAIREEEDTDAGAEIIAQLGELLPIRCSDGQLRPPKFLYHPDAKSVAKLLGDGIGFPDLSLYSEHSDLWMEFFEGLGMARTPRANHIIAAIDGILASDEPEEDKATHISDIAEYLDQHWSDLKLQTIGASESQPGSSTLSLIGVALSDRKWLPAITAAPREYPVQLLAKQTSIFFKPAELLQRICLNIAGSVRPICRILRLFQLQADIGLPAEPPLKDVLTHFENALSIVPSAGDANVNENLLTVFRRVYTFLGLQFADLTADAIESDGRILGIRQRFAHMQCLADSDGRMWLPKHCFADHVTGFLGRRARVRAESDDTDRGLRILGRKDSPRVSDYVAFFKELMVSQAGAEVSEDDRVLLRSAYQAAALLDDGPSFRGSPVLLESGLLVNAAFAVVDDSPWLSERARSAQMQFLDRQLGEAVAIAFDVQLLSSAVYESPFEEQPSQDRNFLSACAELEALIQSPLFCSGVIRLLKSNGSVVRIEELRRFFGDLEVIPASELSTILVWADGDIPVEGSNGPCDVVFDHHRNSIVVSEDAEEVIYERVGSILSNELRIDGHDLRDSTAHLVAILRVAPEAIDRHLSKLRVRALPESIFKSFASDSAEHDGYIDTHDEATELEASSLEHSVDISAPVEPDPPQTELASQFLEEDTTPSIQRVGSEANEPVRDNEPSTEYQGDSNYPRSAEIGPERTLDVLAQSHKPSSFPAGAPMRANELSRRVDPKEPAGAPPPSNVSSQSNSSTTLTEKLLQHRGQLRSEQTPAHRGRARTYVTPLSEPKREEPPEMQLRRQRVDQAAVARVILFEKERGRTPKEMPHMNEGYDIESYQPDGRLDRFIEVKGCSGAWGNLGVAVSRKEFGKASKEGKGFWLYVVEFALEPDRARVYAIQNPAEAVDEYWFDIGWRELAKERGAPVIDIALEIGSAILLDDARLGTVKNIRKRGVLKLLEIEFEDNCCEQVVYSPRRIRILQRVPDEDFTL